MNLNYPQPPPPRLEQDGPHPLHLQYPTNPEALHSSICQSK